MDRFMGFGSDGCSVMTGARTGVATRLKACNPYLTSIHCAAHRANLSVEDCFKSQACEEMDGLVNKLAAFFARSSSRLQVLKDLEQELDYSQLRLHRIQETRWLSRQGAFKRLCECLEPVLEMLRAYRTQQADKLFDKLRAFKHIYIIHFLADILEVMTELSLIFQQSSIDVTALRGLCKRITARIELCYLGTGVDLNGNVLDSKGYPVIPDYGTSSGALTELRSAVKRSFYRGVEMIRSVDGRDLQEALDFQQEFGSILLESINTRLIDSFAEGPLSRMAILAPVNLPSSMRELKAFGAREVQELAEFYGRAEVVQGKRVDGIVNVSGMLEEYALWKVTAASEWRGKSFLNNWGMISGNPEWFTLQTNPH